MTEITLVLPFALPPPELAADLVRALQAPGLAPLLSRTSDYRLNQADPDARALPHELWTGQALGLARGNTLAPTAAAMRGYGLDPAEGHWLIVNPAHIEIARSHLLMTDMRRLGLVESHARALFDSAKPFFDENGNTLLYGDAQTWFMRADGWTELDTATPDAATGMNLTDWLPNGQRAIDYRKLQNEVQMLWHVHPANAEREARGFATINSFWPWGGASAAAVTAPKIVLGTEDAPAWLTAIAQHPRMTGTQLLQEPGTPILFYCDILTEAALATDWAGWLLQMRRLDQELFGPLLDALSGGRLGKLRLVLSDRNRLAEFTTTNMAQRKFWRRPTLDRLLP